MRIIILLPSGHIYANFVAKEIIKKLNQDIALIVESGALIPNETFYNSIKKYIVTSGFAYFFAQSIKQVLFVIGKAISDYLLVTKNDKNIFYSYKKIAASYRIPITKTDNINSLAMREIIKSKNPDLLISLYFRHILHGRILQLPRIGCLNIHPALLPNYRGVSPIFWALAKGEEKVGVTIHWMNKEIDQGDILAQRHISIERGDTEHRLFLKCSAIAVSLLLESLNQLQNNPAVRLKQEKEGSYFSLPDKNAVREFKKKGFRFFRINEFFNGKIV